MENDCILTMEGISKSFPGVKALKNVNLKVKKGEVHCLIGANGAGKSTLMKILAGVYSKDSGEICFDGKSIKISSTLYSKRVGISVIYQELSLVNDLTVAENIFLNNYPKTNFGFVDWERVYKMAASIVKELNLDIDVKEKVSTLSIGKRQLVELMKALACDSKLIVMDEPSATLSEEEFQTLVKVISNLKKKNITIIYISHRLEELFIVGDSITVLRDGENIISLQTKSINVDVLVEYMIGHSLNRVTINPKDNISLGEKVLEIKDLYTVKLKGINLELHKGEIIGLYGLVGSGRTEILRAIFGVDYINNGVIKYKEKKIKFKSARDAIKQGIGLIPENRKTQGLVLTLPVWENSSIVSIKKFIHKGFINYKELYDNTNNFVKNLRIVTPSIKSLIKNLSGGNQQKVVISKWLMNDCDVLLFDEPTQGIDVGAKEEIYKIIKSMASKGKSVIIASSELQELQQVCDKISVLYEGRVVKTFSRDKMNEDEILQAAIAGR